MKKVLIGFSLLFFTGCDQIDRCLDKGGSWDYQNEVCDLYSGLTKKIELGNGYFQEEKRIYYWDPKTQSYKEIDDADYLSFEVRNFGYAKDKNDVFNLHSNAFSNEIFLRKLRYIDPETFVPLDNNFIEDKNGIYYQDYYWNIGPRRINKDLDKESFEILGYGYSKDKNNVYFEWQNIKEANLQSFQLLEKEHCSEWVCWKYAKDKNHVYKFGKILKEAVPETFNPDTFNPDYYYFTYENDRQQFWDYKQMLQKNYYADLYAKDQKNVYLMDNVIPNADPKTFEVVDLDKRISKDSTYLYKGTEIVEDADPNSFIVLNMTYAKDRNHVFIFDYGEVGMQIIPEIDSATTEVFEKDWDIIKDKYGVYYKFEEGSECEGRNDNSFSIKKFKNADIDSFEVVDRRYAKDKNHVYDYGALLKDANPNTFNFD